MPEPEQTNNKRIAKNTLMLYVRMLFLMGVSIYTSRVILMGLGIEDYGIYDVVGGVVGMFSILSGSLSASISRFLTFELGKEDSEKLKRIFSTSVNIQLILFGIVALLAETVGLWFLNTKLVISAERMVAANWVYQFSLVTFGLNLVSLPYNAAIIAHEKMSAFAYISIVEALGKLGIAYMIMGTTSDRLIVYAALMSLMAMVVRMIYGHYCKGHFAECHYRLMIDKELIGDMFGFAGWNAIGASSAILRDMGGKIAINMFHGTAVNAARGISMQVSQAVLGFSSNFMTALNPQITKSYAAGQTEYMMTLVFQGARLSFYMLSLLSLPILFSTDYLIGLWLHEVPEHSVLFTQLALIFSMEESISHPLVTAMLATGRIKTYQIIVGGIQMLNFPVSYALLWLGLPPEVVLVVAIALGQCCLAARLVLLRGLIGLNAREYIKQVYLNVLAVLAVSSLLPSAYLAWHGPADSIGSFVGLSAITVCSTVASIYAVGCNQKEKGLIVTHLRRLAPKKQKS